MNTDDLIIFLLSQNQILQNFQRHQMILRNSGSETHNKAKYVAHHGIHNVSQSRPMLYLSQIDTLYWLYMLKDYCVFSHVWTSMLWHFKLGPGSIMQGMVGPLTTGTRLLEISHLRRHHNRPVPATPTYELKSTYHCNYFAQSFLCYHFLPHHHTAPPVSVLCTG